MQKNWRKLRRKMRHWFSVALLRLTLCTAKALPYKIRIKIGSAVIAALARIPRNARTPISEHTARIYPNWSDNERQNFMRKNIRHFSQNLMELYNIQDFSNRQDRFHISGTGLETLREQQANGKGAIIVSGHFGHWEAIRAYWNANGMPLSAIYKKAHNPYYETIFARALQQNGEAVHTGVRGMSKLVKTLKSGGFISILHDQKLKGAPLLPFLNENVHTSTAAAELALKYDVPLVPAYAIRRANGYDYDIIFEAPIQSGTAIDMARAMNQSLEAQIRKHPEQWLWLYDRWSLLPNN